MTGWLPGILRQVRALLRNFISHSYQVYNRLFTWLAPAAADIAEVDILHRWARVVAASITSIFISGLVILVLGWSYPLWLLILVALHGAVVGIQWEQLDQTAGFRLGVDL